MLIVNDNQLLLAGGVSMEVRCTDCSQPLTTYPLIMSDDAERTVSHAACAVELATDLLVDLFPFLSPPPPCERLFVLTAPDAAPSQETHVKRECQRCGPSTSASGKEESMPLTNVRHEEVRCFGIKPSSARHRSVVPPGWSRSSRVEGTAASADLWLGSLFPRGAGQH